MAGAVAVALAATMAMTIPAWQCGIEKLQDVAQHGTPDTHGMPST